MTRVESLPIAKDKFSKAEPNVKSQVKSQAMILNVSANIEDYVEHKSLRRRKYVTHPMRLVR